MSSHRDRLADSIYNSTEQSPRRHGLRDARPAKARGPTFPRSSEPVPSASNPVPVKFGPHPRRAGNGLIRAVVPMSQRPGTWAHLLGEPSGLPSGERPSDSLPMNLQPSMPRAVWSQVRKAVARALTGLRWFFVGGRNGLHRASAHCPVCGVTPGVIARWAFTSASQLYFCSRSAIGPRE